MSKLESVLPKELTDRALKLGDGLASLHTELVLPYVEALRAVDVASEHQIAILGVEAFEVQDEGLLTVGLIDPSSYISFSGDWNAYVSTTNAESERWLRTHRLGEDHGYILTSTSFDEFSKLKVK